MLNNAQIVLAEQEFKDFLLSRYGEDIKGATDEQLYYSLSYVTNNLLYEKKSRNKILNEENLINGNLKNKNHEIENDISKNKKNINQKTVHYLSIEFLIGKSLRNNLWNLEMEDHFTNLLNFYGRDIEKIYNIEKDAGLGNGGLGRLAACYLESLAKCGFNAFGHSIKYEYGLFKQMIVDGKQKEFPDEWLNTGKVWLFERYDQMVEIKIGGKIVEHYSEETGLKFEIKKPKIIEAVPYDYIVSAYGTDNTSTLRLWEARAKESIDIHLFDIGEYESSLKNQTKVSEINKILYPNDNNPNGKDLRLIQQYFLVSAVLQSVIKNYFKENNNLDNLSKLIAVHINDTHPALCVPEFMRILIDDYGYGWNESWECLKNVISYTNHTILAESLEIKKMSSIERLMPRIALILREIDKRFRLELQEFFKNDYNKIERLAVISGDNVYMANLAVCSSYKVNGVAKIHSKILQTKLFKYYKEMYDDKFLNITNGISIRRWLSSSNKELDKLINSLIGSDYYNDANKLKELEKFESNTEILNKLADIKMKNKERFANYVKSTLGIEIDPTARFDIQAKRIHEYKRQLMNIMKVIYLAEQIKKNPNQEVTKQVFIFAGKAASSYVIAKRIIELIVSVS